MTSPKTTAKPAKTTAAKQTPKPAAKPAPKPNATTRPAPAAAPAAAINLAELGVTGVNLIHLLAVSAEPVSSAAHTPAAGLSLQSLVKRGIAQLVPGGSGTEKLYGLTDAGQVLAALLWPGVKPAPAKQAAKPRATRKPVAKAEPVEAEAADSTV